MAGVHSPKILTPTKVTAMQNHLTEAVGRPTGLIVHCILSIYVSALGSVGYVVTHRLDGTFVKGSDTPTLNFVAKAEQVLRKYFAGDGASKLFSVEYRTLGQRRMVVDHILGLRKLASEEIALPEAPIREAGGDEAVVGVTAIERTVHNNEGEVLYGWILGDKGTPKVRECILQVREDLASAFSGEPGHAPVTVNATQLDGRLHFLLEIVGP
jgi:hypothetical protein